MWLMFVNRNHAMFVFQKMTSGVRQNFHQDCEAAINRQINLELYASYVYLSMVRPKACSLQRQWHCHAHFHLTTRFRFSLQSHASLFKVYTIVFFFCSHTTLTVMTSHSTTLPSSSAISPMRSVSMPRNWWNYRTSAEDGSSYKTSGYVHGAIPTSLFEVWDFYKCDLIHLRN